MEDSSLTTQDITVTMYVDSYILTGFLQQPAELRLTDFLNQEPEEYRDRVYSLIEVFNANIWHYNGRIERRPMVYVNKSAIILVLTEDANLGRGLGASKDIKSHPYIQKEPVRITTQVRRYELSGNMHCCPGEQPIDTLRSASAFLPLTNVKIREQSEDIWRNAPFAALNRRDILALHQM